MNFTHQKRLENDKINENAQIYFSVRICVLFQFVWHRLAVW